MSRPPARNRYPLPRGARGSTRIGYFASLALAKGMLLTTFRRDGTPVSAAVPGVVDGGRAYFGAWSRSGSVKRLRHSGLVQVTPCSVRGFFTNGPPLDAVARTLSGQEATGVAGKLARKYPVRHRFLLPLGRQARRWQWCTTNCWPTTPRAAMTWARRTPASMSGGVTSPGLTRRTRARAYDVGTCRPASGTMARPPSQASGRCRSANDARRRPGRWSQGTDAGPAKTRSAAAWWPASPANCPRRWRFCRPTARRCRTGFRSRHQSVDQQRSSSLPHAAVVTITTGQPALARPGRAPQAGRPSPPRSARARARRYRRGRTAQCLRRRTPRADAS